MKPAWRLVILPAEPVYRRVTPQRAIARRYEDAVEGLAALVRGLRAWWGSDAQALLGESAGAHAGGVRAPGRQSGADVRRVAVGDRPCTAGCDRRRKASAAPNRRRARERRRAAGEVGGTVPQAVPAFWFSSMSSE